MTSYPADLVGRMLLVAFFFGFMLCIVMTALLDWIAGLVGRYAAHKMHEHETETKL